MPAAHRTGVPVPTEWNAPLAHAHAGWVGLPTVLYRLPGSGEGYADIHLPDPLLAVARSGSGTRTYTSAARTWDVAGEPRIIELHAAGFQVDHIAWKGTSGEVVGVQFPATKVKRLLHDDSPTFDLVTKHEVSDDQVTDLVFALWNEASSGSPHGELYVDGLTLALIGLLTTHHGAHRTAAGPRVAKFSSPERARLREFIASELAGNLRVERLAAQVQMSPAHFARVFRATFGLSPHAYVVEQRLDVACRALRQEPERAISEVALATGFSSQSHFTDVFRRKVGMTPASWRCRG